MSSEATSGSSLEATGSSGLWQDDDEEDDDESPGPGSDLSATIYASSAQSDGASRDNSGVIGLEVLSAQSVAKDRWSSPRALSGAQTQAVDELLPDDPAYSKMAISSLQGLQLQLPYQIPEHSPSMGVYRPGVSNIGINPSYGLDPILPPARGEVTGTLATISPLKYLVFDAQKKKESFDFVRVTNNYYTKIAVKVKSTAPEFYRISPKLSVIKPGDKEDIRIFIQPNAPSPENDRFQIQIVQLKDATMDPYNIPPAMWAGKTQAKTMFHRLICMVRHGFHPLQRPMEAPPLLQETRGEFVGNIATISPEKTLTFDKPQQGRETMDYVRISNTHYYNIAVKIKATTAEYYKMSPKILNVNPGDTGDVKIYLQSNNPHPEQDKFLVQIIELRDSTVDVTRLPSQMWNGSPSTKAIELRLNCKLRGRGNLSGSEVFSKLQLPEVNRAEPIIPVGDEQFVSPDMSYSGLQRYAGCNVLDQKGDKPSYVIYEQNFRPDYVMRDNIEPPSIEIHRVPTQRDGHHSEYYMEGVRIAQENIVPEFVRKYAMKWKLRTADPGVPDIRVEDVPGLPPGEHMSDYYMEGLRVEPLVGDETVRDASTWTEEKPVNKNYHFTYHPEVPNIQTTGPEDLDRTFSLSDYYFDGFKVGGEDPIQLPVSKKKFRIAYHEPLEEIAPASQVELYQPRFLKYMPKSLRHSVDSNLQFINRSKEMLQDSTMRASRVAPPLTSITSYAAGVKERMMSLQELLQQHLQDVEEESPEQEKRNERMYQIQPDETDENKDWWEPEDVNKVKLNAAASFQRILSLEPPDNLYKIHMNQPSRQRRHTISGADMAYEKKESFNKRPTVHNSREEDSSQVTQKKSTAERVASLERMFKAVTGSTEKSLASGYVGASLSELGDQRSRMTGDTPTDIRSRHWADGVDNTRSIHSGDGVGRSDNGQPSAYDMDTDYQQQAIEKRPWSHRYTMDNTPDENQGLGSNQVPLNINPVSPQYNHMSLLHNHMSSQYNQAYQNQSPLHYNQPPTNNNPAYPYPNQAPIHYTQFNPNQVQLQYNQVQPNPNQIQLQYNQVQPNPNQVQLQYNQVQMNPNQVQLQYSPGAVQPNQAPLHTIVGMQWASELQGDNPSVRADWPNQSVPDPLDNPWVRDTSVDSLHKRSEDEPSRGANWTDMIINKPQNGLAKDNSYTTVSLDSVSQTSINMSSKMVPPLRTLTLNQRLAQGMHPSINNHNDETVKLPNTSEVFSSHIEALQKQLKGSDHSLHAIQAQRMKMIGDADTQESTLVSAVLDLKKELEDLQTKKLNLEVELRKSIDPDTERLTQKVWHNKVKSEIERILSSIDTKEKEIDKLREHHLGLLDEFNQREDSLQQERRQLLDNIEHLEEERRLLENDLSFKSYQVESAKQQLGQQSNELSTAERQLRQVNEEILKSPPYDMNEQGKVKKDKKAPNVKEKKPKLTEEKLEHEKVKMVEMLGSQTKLEKKMMGMFGVQMFTGVAILVLGIIIVVSITTAA